MSPQELKHLEFIQNVITRMNTNSFRIKSLSIIIISVLIAIHGLLPPIPPTLMFWFLDAYYLNQERRFRGLYNDVAGITHKREDIKLFSMSIASYKGGKYSYWSSFCSRTILTMYLGIILVLLAIFVYFKYLNIFEIF